MKGDQKSLIIVAVPWAVMEWHNGHFKQFIQ